MSRTTPRLHRYSGWFALALPCLLGTPIARGADENLDQFKAKIEAEVNSIKEKYESKIQGLENRVETLESENAQLKNQKSASAHSPEVASLKQRVARLEHEKTENTTTPVTPDPQTTANTAAIRKLQ